MRFLWPRVAYRPLIGPTFFPVYVLVLKLALGLTVLVTAGFAILGPTGDAESRPRLLGVLTFLIQRGLVAFGSTTLAFAALDLWHSRLFRQASWDPRRLPAVVRLEDRVSRLDSLIQLALVSAGLVWLLLVPFFPILLLGRAAQVLRLAPIWSAVYVPMVVLTAAQVVFHATTYRRPYWTPARSVARILLRLGALLLWLTLLSADTWVNAKGGSTMTPVPSIEQIVHGVNISCKLALIVASIGSASAIVREILLIRSRRRARPPVMLTEWHLPWPVAVLVIVVFAALVGLVHGLLITRLRLQPFVVTLCGLLVYRGLARFIADDETKGFGDAAGFRTLQHLMTGSLFGVPTPFVAMALIGAVMWVVLHRSVYGRHLFATGRNETAARFSGIDVRRVIVSTYVILGVLTGISAIFFAFYTNSISPSSHGSFFELYGIAAAVLGGCSLRGGEGSIVGILLGTTLLQVLQNLVNLLGIPSSLNFAVMTFKLPPRSYTIAHLGVRA